jgi:hypothetical protein
VLVGAAVCPHPPLLVPAAMGDAGWPETVVPTVSARPGPGITSRVAGTVQAGQVTAASPAEQVDEQIRLLRGACFDAVRALADEAPDVVFVVGPGTVNSTYPGTAAGSLRAYGVAFDVGSGPPVLPLSLTIGAWLARRCLPDSCPCPAEFLEIAGTTPPGECLELGAALAARSARVALLVLGDGSARRALGVPGAADPAAAEFDTRLAGALGTADARALAAIDPAAADEVGAAGRVAWQVLAGAALAGSALADPAPARGWLRYAGAPLDVGYAVASWSARPGRSA